MGQYFTSVNLDTREYLSPLDYNQGSKLMEHSYIKNSFMGLICQLLMPGNQWHMNRIVWAGDYGEEGLFINEDEPSYKGELGNGKFNRMDYTLYHIASSIFNQIKVNNIDGITPQFIINHTKNQYVDLNNCQTMIHPLSILTSNGNGQGGGDYFEEEGVEYIGTWAGDIISTNFILPKGFTEIKPNFSK